MSTKIYTHEEVSLHNGKSGSTIWIIIKNSVYDVTDYLDEHPGGGELILEYAGKDATSGFNDFGHSSDAINQLKLYKIGEILHENKRKNEKSKQKAGNLDEKENNLSKRKNRRFLFPLFKSCAV